MNNIYYGYVLGLILVLMGVVLWRGGGHPPVSRSLKIISGLLVLSGLGLAVACLWWVSFPGLSLAKWALGPAVVVLGGVWLAYCRVLKVAGTAPGRRLYRRLCAWAGVVFGAWLLGGWGIALLVWDDADRDVRQEMAQSINMTAALIDPEPVRQLRWSEADLSLPTYQDLKRQMLASRRSNPFIRFTYLMGLHDGKAFFLVDSEPPDSPDYSPPGQWFEEVVPEFLAGLNAGRSFVSGPATDRWGTWVSSLAPVWEDAERKIYLGMDLSAADWEARLAMRLRPALLLWGALALLFAVFFNAWERQIAATERVVRSEQKYKGLFDGAPNCICHLDDQARITLINAAGLEKLGHAGENWGGRYFRDLWPESQQGPVQAVLDQVRQAAARVVTEVDYTRPNGELTVWEMAVTPMQVEGPHVREMLVVMVDVSQRKVVEEHLRYNEERFRRVVQHTQEFIYSHIPEGILVFVSDSVRRLGYEPARILGRHMLEFCHPDDRARAVAAIEQSSQGQAHANFEFRLPRADGSYMWASASTEPVIVDGRLVQINGVVRDITEHKKADARLHRRLQIEAGVAGCSRALLRRPGAAALAEALRNLRQASDADRVYIFQNFLGPQKDLRCRQLQEVCAPGVRPQIDNPELQDVSYAPFARWVYEFNEGKIVRGLVRDFPASEQALLAPQGIRSLLALPLYQQGEWYGFIGFDDTHTGREWDAEDVRLLRTASEMISGYLSLEKALLAVEEIGARFKVLADSLPDLVCYKRAAGPYVHVNQAFARFAGCPQEQLPGRTDAEVLPAGVAAARAAHEAQALRSSQAVSFEEEIQGRDGQAHAYETTILPVAGPTGRVEEWMCVSRDLTAPRRTTAALRQSQRQLQALMNIVPDIVWVKDLDGHYLAANNAYGAICGISAEALADRTDYDLWPEELAREYAQADAEVIRTRQLLKREERVVHVMGGTCWFETSKAPILDTNGQVIGTCGIARDITELKRFAHKQRGSQEEFERQLDERTEALRKNNLELHDQIIKRIQAHAAEVETRNYFETLIQALPDPVYVKNPQHGWVLANPAYCAFVGKRPDELLGHDEYDVYSQAEAEAAWERENDVFRTGQPGLHRETYTDRAGGLRVAWVRRVRFTDPQGRPLLLGVLQPAPGEKPA